MSIIGQHPWVRIGVMWGYIDTTTCVFWPVDVADEGFEDWSNRRLNRDGYVDADRNQVEGKWYQLFPDTHESYYLFVSSDMTIVEWAKAQDNTRTRNGSGSKFVIGALVGDKAKARTLSDAVRKRLRPALSHTDRRGRDDRLVPDGRSSRRSRGIRDGGSSVDISWVAVPRGRIARVHLHPQATRGFRRWLIHRARRALGLG